MHLCPTEETWRYERLKELIPTCPSPDVMLPLPKLLKALNDCNCFADSVHVKSIGHRVFPGYGAWGSLVGGSISFTGSVVQAWRDGALDYYTIVARKNALL